jgi:acyl-coenzyme A synthetase/AMP-(fatty) acid ligase
MEGAAKKIAYKPLIDGALAQSRVRSVQNVVMLQRPEGPAALTDGYLDWEVAMARIRSKGLQADPEWVESSHPQYCLYTSGTTSLPVSAAPRATPHDLRYLVGTVRDVRTLCCLDEGFL